MNSYLEECIRYKNSIDPSSLSSSLFYNKYKVNIQNLIKSIVVPNDTSLNYINDVYIGSYYNCKIFMGKLVEELLKVGITIEYYNPYGDKPDYISINVYDSDRRMHQLEDLVSVAIDSIYKGVMSHKFTITLTLDECWFNDIGHIKNIIHYILLHSEFLGIYTIDNDIISCNANNHTITFKLCGGLAKSAYHNLSKLEASIIRRLIGRYIENIDLIDRGITYDKYLLSHNVLYRLGQSLKPTDRLYIDMNLYTDKLVSDLLELGISSYIDGESIVIDVRKNLSYIKGRNETIDKMVEDLKHLHDSIINIDVGCTYDYEFDDKAALAIINDKIKNLKIKLDYDDKVSEYRLRRFKDNEFTTEYDRSYIVRRRPINIKAYRTSKELDIKTLEGTMKANVGDWIITGVNNEQYPCKHEIFTKIYDIVED